LGLETFEVDQERELETISIDGVKGKAKVRDVSPLDIDCKIGDI
jgi:hypothetical protein